MWIRFCNWFTKVTAFPVQLLCFRTKTVYEDKKAFRAVKGPMLIVSNHTSVFDYAVYIFVFFFRTLRTVMAEVLFKKPVLGTYLRCMGGIRVDRAAHEFGFVEEALGILEKKGTVLIFPESRLPVDGEERPLPFKESVAYLALRSGVPVVPVYTSGSYFRFKRARVVVGKPVLPAEWIPEGTPEKEAMQEVTARLRETVIALGKQLP